MLSSSNIIGKVVVDHKSWFELYSAQFHNVKFNQNLTFVNALWLRSFIFRLTYQWFNLHLAHPRGCPYGLTVLENSTDEIRPTLMSYESILGHVGPYTVKEISYPANILRAGSEILLRFTEDWISTSVTESVLVFLLFTTRTQFNLHASLRWELQEYRPLFK